MECRLNLFLLRVLLLIILTFYNPQSFLVTLLFQLILKGLAESVLKSSNPLFPSGTIFTEKRFSHLPHKSQVLYLFQYNISHLFHLIHIIDFFLQLVWQSTWKILIRNCQMYMQQESIKVQEKFFGRSGANFSKNY